MRLLTILVLLGAVSFARAEGVKFDARTAKGGAWSDAGTWENGRAPKAGDFVQVRPGHAVVYDIESKGAFRMVHVGGTLSFSREKSTLMEVGLLKVQAGEAAAEDGFVCAIHEEAAKVEHKSPTVPSPWVEKTGRSSAALEVGTAERPMPAGTKAVIRLVYFEGTDKDNLPAIVDCGGRMDFHGAPMSRTWVKLAKPVKKGDAQVVLEEAVSGWRVGDRVILTAGKPLEYVPEEGGGRRKYAVSQTEERIIAAIAGANVTLDKPVEYEHAASEEGRCEVANLSRNVVVESADVKVARGHTMYHRHSSGSISYAEFRGLGKENVLGRYPIHFHLLRDGMRGGGVLGASIWDSGNRFMAIHGTDYLLVRDNVGYGCVGHGFFMEDATEQYNIIDRNLAVQAREGKRLPNQALAFDANEGAGFWWANGRNTFTRNVACENHRYGFRFEIGKVRGKPPVLVLRQPDGTTAEQDVRTIPFLRFDSNESHSEGLYSFFFGDDPAGSVKGDRKHPFIARNLFAWQTHYAMRPSVSHFLMEKLYVERAAYGVYHPDYDAHVYRDIRISRVGAEPINRGHDDESIQFGSFTYDGLSIENCAGMPLIQLSCTAPIDGLSGHFKNLKVTPTKARQQRVVDLGVGPILRDKDLKRGVAYYFHEADPAKTRRVVSVKFPRLMDGAEYKAIEGFTGKNVRAAEVSGVTFPQLLDPVDDLPPATMITASRKHGGKHVVRGVTQDNGEVVSVIVNGKAAKLTSGGAGVVDWEVVVDDGGELSAVATDAAGNVERTGASVATAR